ncbi:hypothetical protein GpartN1_g3426.t1 [Galdieria partita]|uniref:Uncharacterized protein n=1 Tax=Galdieria partita TaxID=83374 RepID=A0A9C7UQI4_9RHOD|nr:hypothetical protein GpartN1_g3426.t1 [Galdieria partita]
MLVAGGPRTKSTSFVFVLEYSTNGNPFQRKISLQRKVFAYQNLVRATRPWIEPRFASFYKHTHLKQKLGYFCFCVMKAKVSTGRSLTRPQIDQVEDLSSLEEAFESALRVVWDRKPKGYWSSIENLANELGRLIEKYDSIPSTAELRQRKKSSLVKAIADFGGRKVLADVMGLRAKKLKWKEPSLERDSQEYSFDKEKRDLFERIKRLREALSIISFRKYGVFNRIPSLKALERMKLSTVLKEIQELGGIAKVATLINFKIGEKEFDEVACDLLQIGASLGYRFPTMKELNQMGRSDLRRAVSLYGGVSVVAQRIGLEVLAKAGRPPGDHSARKPQRLWSNEKLLKALKEFQKNTTMLPSANELVSLGRYDILYQIRARGGHRKVACQLGLKSRRQGSY